MSAHLIFDKGVDIQNLWRNHNPEKASNDILNEQKTWKFTFTELLKVSKTWKTTQMSKNRRLNKEFMVYIHIYAHSGILFDYKKRWNHAMCFYIAEVKVYCADEVRKNTQWSLSYVEYRGTVSKWQMVNSNRS